ncbi:MAG: glycosyltransferase [Anaerolineae bacterium]
MSARTRIVFFFSDTGGGHRSAAEAIRDAIDETWPGQAEVFLVDFFLEGLPRPLNRLGSLYSPMVQSGWAWKAAWEMGEFRVVKNTAWQPFLPMLVPRLRKIIELQKPDVVVSVHPIVTHPMALAVHALPHPMPALTIVTDLVYGSRTWFEPQVNFTYVPTDEARDKAVRCGLPPTRVETVGQPVSPRFRRFTGDRAALRQRLGMRADLPGVLIVGGGEGMGAVFENARAVATSGLPVQLVVIAGRNDALREQLNAVTWEVPTVVNGFVRNMPEWMAAVDVLVTKAGPGTIAEGMIAGRPLIIFGYVPGQEESNVDWVVKHQVGAAAFNPKAVVAQLQEWLAPGSTALTDMAERALALARPDAARELGKRIMMWAEKTP